MVLKRTKNAISTVRSWDSYLYDYYVHWFKMLKWLNQTNLYFVRCIFQHSKTITLTSCYCFFLLSGCQYLSSVISLFAGFVLWYKRISDSDFCRQEETYILHICVLIFRVTFIQLIWRLVKQIACSYSFSFWPPGELWLYSLVFYLDLIWRVPFIHKTKLFSFYPTSTRFWCRVVWDGQPSLV